MNKKIIVCLDVKDGKTTKGIKFKDNIEVGDPLEMAIKYQEQQADELVLYDITASLEGRTAMIELVKTIASNIRIPFTVGGGISTVEQIQSILEAGADRVSINSPAVKNPLLLKEASEKFGKEKIWLGVDAQKSDTPSGYTVMVGGGKIDTGKDLMEWIKEAEALGFGGVVLNSVDADGTKDGYDCVLTKLVKDNVSVPVIASGGAGKAEHLLTVFNEANADIALVASIVHYNDYTVDELKRFLRENSINI